MLRRILGIALVAFIVYYVVTDPNGAANTATAALGWLKQAASAVTTLLARITH